MITTLSYLHTKHWHPTKVFKHKVIGYCPLHTEHTPSFHLWNDGHWRCFGAGCGYGGNVVAMINHLEFGFDDSDQGWARAKDHYKLLSGLPVTAGVGTDAGAVHRREILRANEEEQAVLTLFMKWCHYHLWSRRGQRGREYYERERGVPLSTLKPLIQVGYVPWLDTRNYTDRLLYGELANAMLTHVGKDWRQVAIALGILWEREGEPDRLSLTDRVMHFCVDPDHLDQAMFYHGRKAQFKGEPVPPYKHMCPWSVAKVPFTVPIEEPTHLAGTVHVESPFGVLALATHTIRSLGWIGGEPRSLWMRRYPRPDIIVTDYDPRYDAEGVLVIPGEVYAEKFVSVAQFLDRAYMRVRPYGAKDLDTALKLHGIQPFLREVEQQSGHGPPLLALPTSVY